MGVFTFDASVLLLQGDNLLPFLDGLTTNKVDGPCTTVFTNLHAKIIDVCEVIPFNDQVVLVGFEASKSNLIEHLQQFKTYLIKILNQDSQMDQKAALRILEDAATILTKVNNW